LAKLDYTFKTDTLFKMLFVKHQDLLKNLVSTLLGIPQESIGHFEVTNPDIPPENLGEKFCRLDINMTVDGQRLALEIQVAREGGYTERVLYYWAREYSSSLPEGGKYRNLPRTVVISIIDFNQFECAHFHSEFCPLEVTRHEHLSDKMSLHFFELQKLPVVELKASNKLLLWLSLFKPNTEEELAQIKALEEPIMEQAINAYQRITATDEFKERERLRHYARLNEASAIDDAEQREREKWQGVVAGKDVEIADKDVEIEKLRLQIAELQAKAGG